MKIFYYISNNGDGSVSTIFCESEKLAEIMEEYEVESYGEGWAESSVGSLNIVSVGAMFPEFNYTVDNALARLKDDLSEEEVDSKTIKEFVTKLKELQ